MTMGVDEAMGLAYSDQYATEPVVAVLSAEVERLQAVVANQTLAIDGALKALEWFEEREAFVRRAVVATSRDTDLMGGALNAYAHGRCDVLMYEQENPKPGTARVCVCGQPDTPNVVHRTDGPCFHPSPGAATWPKENPSAGGD